MQHLNAHMCKHVQLTHATLCCNSTQTYVPTRFQKKLVTVPTETSSMNLWRPINMEATNHKDINHMAPAARTEQAMTVLPFRANSAKIVGSSNQSTVGSSNLKVHCLFGGASLFTVVACVATTSSSESSHRFLVAKGLVAKGLSSSTW